MSIKGATTHAESAKDLPHAVKQLLDAQKQYFKKIVAELQQHGRKTSHWAWYVWPTSMIGRSDSLRTRVTDETAIILLQQTDLGLWTKIFCLLSECLTAGKRVTKIIPAIDHGRIRYFFSFWIEKHGKAVSEAFPSFYDEIVRFSILFKQNEKLSAKTIHFKKPSRR